MSLSRGKWGTSQWGTDKWGVCRSGITVDACTVSPLLIKALIQDPETNLQVSATILVDDVDVSSVCTRFEIHIQGNGKASWATLSFSSSAAPSITVHQSVVSILINYTLSDGTVFSTERFRGTAHLKDNYKNSADDVTGITCYDQFYSLMEGRSKNSFTYYVGEGYVETSGVSYTPAGGAVSIYLFGLGQVWSAPGTPGTWVQVSAYVNSSWPGTKTAFTVTFPTNNYSVPAGSSRDILQTINSELMGMGFSPASGSFVNGFVGEFTDSFKNASDIIYALANTYRPSFFLCRPNGQIFIHDFASIPSSGWTIPLESQVSQMPESDGISQANKVTFTGPVRGSETSIGVYEKITYSYEDLADQALNGIREVDHKNFSLLSWNQAKDIAEIIVSESKKQKYSWETPLNPFLYPAESVILELKDGGTATVRIDEIVDTGGWPGGFWSKFKGQSTV